MYKDDVKDLCKQNLLYNLRMLKEFLIVYSKLIVLMPNNFEVRDSLIQLSKEWFAYSKRERDILKYIFEKYKNIEDDLNVDFVLEQLDEIFENMFDYYDDILEGYEEMISLKQSHRAKINKPDFELLTEEKKMNLIKIMNDNC